MSSVTVHYGTKPLNMSYKSDENIVTEEDSIPQYIEEKSKMSKWFHRLLISHNDPDKPHLFQILLEACLWPQGYSPLLFLLSIVIALIASVAALVIVYSSKTIIEHFFAAVVVAVAVSGMHYTGMAAVTYYEYVEVNLNNYMILQPFQLVLIVIVSSLFTCMLMMMIVSAQNSSRNEVLDRLVESKTKQLTEEINRSEELLLNILPPRIALKMKQGVTDIYEEYSNATILFSDIVGFTKLIALKMKQGVTDIYEEYSNATILFSDIVGFTKLSNTMTSKQLVLLLNDL
eukprot:gene5261-8879_t